MPARGSGSFSINPRLIQQAARRFAPPIAHVAPKTRAPSRHTAPPPAWKGVPTSPFTGALHQAYTRQARSEQPKRLPRGAVTIPQSQLIASGQQARFEAANPLVGSQGRQRRAEQLAKVLVPREEGRRRAEAQKRAGGGALNIPGVINLTPLVSKLAAVKPLGSGSGVLGLLQRVGNEAIDLPAQSLLSGAITGSAARQALPGLPLGLGGSGDPRALEGIGRHILGELKDPVGSLGKTPLNTALLLAGGENVLGRLAGKAGRIGEGVDKVTREVTKPGLIPSFSQGRPDLKLLGEQQPAGPVDEFGQPPQAIPGLRKEQKYNPDPLRKAVQVAHEKAQPKLPGPLRQADPFQAEGRRLSRELAGGYLKVGRVDRIANAGEATRRQFVKGTTAKVAALGKGLPKHVRHAVPLIVQGIVKHPDTVVADLAKEAQKLKDAQPELKPSEKGTNAKNLKLVEALQADRAFLADPSKAFAAARRVIQIQRPLEAILIHGGKLTPEAVRAKLFPYAQAHMGAVHVPAEKVEPWDTPPSQGLHANGRPLSNEEILAHIRQNTELKDVGFLSHKPGKGSSGDFYQSTGRFPPVESYARSGEAFRKGTADHSFEALGGSLAHQASQAAQLEVRARNLTKLALTPKGGPFKDRKAAVNWAKNNVDFLPTGEPAKAGLGSLKAIHLGAKEILEQGNVTPAEVDGTLKQFGLEGYKSAVGTGKGKYGLIHEDVLKRLGEHEEALTAKNNLHRALQSYQQGFRRAKLNLSTRHIVGVGQEQAIRLIAEQVAPAFRIAGHDFGGRAGRVALKYERAVHHLAETDVHGHLFDDAGPLGSPFREIEASLGRRGGVVSSQAATDVVRKGRAWQGTSMSSTLARAADDAAHSRSGRVLLAPWHGWQKLVEGNLIHLEHATATGLTGKALKDTGFINDWRSALKLTDEGMQELVKGTMTPNKADAIARAVDDMMGNWSHQTPAVRKIVGNYAPFGLWWLNSMRWLYRLPVTHPIKTGIMGALYNATRQARNEKGQGFDAPKAAPGFLQGGISLDLPVVGKVTAQPSYYSPGGTLGPELGKTAVEQFVPALRGIESAAEGVNPLTFEHLTDQEKREISPLSLLTNVLAEGVSGPTPGATQVQSLLQRGGKPYGTANLITDLLEKVGGPAQVKPGTTHSLIENLFKTVFPLRIVRSKAKAGASGTKALSDAEVARLRTEAFRKAEGRGGGLSDAELAKLREKAWGGK